MNNFYIHQVYGLYDDGKPLSDNELFMESHLKYKEICDKNNYKYNFKFLLLTNEIRIRFRFRLK